MHGALITLGILRGNGHGRYYTVIQYCLVFSVYTFLICNIHQLLFYSLSHVILSCSSIRQVHFMDNIYYDTITGKVQPEEAVPHLCGLSND